jgi:hypothetical protein
MEKVQRESKMEEKSKIGDKKVTRVKPKGSNLSMGSYDAISENMIS